MNLTYILLISCDLTWPNLTSPHFISTWVRCDWSNDKLITAVKQPSLLWLRPLTLHSLQMKWG